MVATNPANGPCNEANADQAAFVQAAVIDPVTGQISIYDPLVIDKDTQPATPPVVPKLPGRGIVGIWFGSNGNTLTLQGTGTSLQDGHCVNGVGDSIFGQVSYCNSPAFFKAANAAIQAGKLVSPPLGRAKDGLPCPTSRDFALVDQDQSDNVTTTYLVTGNGQTAQMTAANMAALMNGHPDLNKLNAYRVGVDQSKVQSLNAANTKIYCTNLLAIGPQRLLLDAHLTKAAPSPDPAAANTLFTFLAQRFVFTFGADGLNCTKWLGVPDPVSVKTDRNGEAIDATINGTTIFTPVDCSVNGTVMIGCTGTTTINGQACSFVFNGKAHQVDITCPAAK